MNDVVQVEKETEIEGVKLRKIIEGDDVAHEIHFSGDHDSTWIEVTEKQYEHVKQVVGKIDDGDRR